jgi:ubiquinone/menaquinone biosynthesis C-methylase UbiE
MSASELPAYSMNRPAFPLMYERSLVGTLFRPWAERLVERAALAPGMRVLDVACGTGIVARLAHRRLGASGAVVGVDVSPPMLNVAHEIEPGVDWRVGDAAALPIAADERFDRVFCQQGLQFFADRQTAVRQLHRALEPNGLALVSVWRSAEEMPVFAALQRAAERHAGPINDERYAFGDGAALERLLSDAGFRDVQVETMSIAHRFEDGAELVRMNAMALVGMSHAKLDEQGRERMLEAIVRDSEAAAGPFLEGAALVCEMRSNVAVARP